MRVRRISALFVVVAAVMAACSSGGGDTADDLTRNISLTTAPIKTPAISIAPTSTKPSPFTTTVPPSPNTTGFGVGRNIPNTTSLSDALRSTSSSDLTCFILEVKGGLSSPQASIPYNEVLQGRSSGNGVFRTSCDDTVFNPTASDNRVFLLPIGAPKINSYDQVGRTAIQASQERPLIATFRVDVIPPDISDALRRNNVARLSYDYKVSPANVARSLSSQMTSGAIHSGQFEAIGDECFNLSVRVAEDRSNVNRTGVVRAPSEWSPSEPVCMDPVENDPFVMIAFGDSYGSGEGNAMLPMTNYGPRCNGFWFYERACVETRPYLYPDTFAYHEVGVDEVVWGTANQCHRSSQSGVAKAVDVLRDRWGLISPTYYVNQNMYFAHFACSGAVSKHIFDSTYNPDFDPPIPSSQQYPCERAWKGRTGSCKLMPPQSDIAKYWLERQDLTPYDVDAVVVSIGGNDAGFKTLVGACFMIPDFSCNDTTLLDGIQLEEPVKTVAGLFGVENGPMWVRSEALTDLRNAIRNVASKARATYPNADVFFTTYIDPVSVSSTNPADRDRDGVCSRADLTNRSEYPNDFVWDISASESRWLRGTVNDINRTIRDTVAALNSPKTFVIDQQSAATNNGFCTGAAQRNMMFNSEAVNTQGADYVDTLDFQISSGGWHPNDLGYRLYGEAIAAAVQRSSRFLQTWPMISR